MRLADLWLFFFRGGTPPVAVFDEAEFVGTYVPERTFVGTYAPEATFIGTVADDRTFIGTLGQV